MTSKSSWIVGNDPDKVTLRFVWSAPDQLVIAGQDVVEIDLTPAGARFLAQRLIDASIRAEAEKN